MFAKLDSLWDDFLKFEKTFYAFQFWADTQLTDNRVMHKISIQEIMIERHRCFHVTVVVLPWNAR